MNAAATSRSPQRDREVAFPAQCDKLGVLAAVFLLGGCATSSEPAFAPVVVHPFPAKSEKASQPLDWQEIDKSTQRAKARALKKPAEKESSTVTQTAESGFWPMTEEDYATAQAKAEDEIRKAYPKMSESEVEKAAVAQADKEKRQYEQTYRTRTSTSQEWKKSWNW